jgi:hypothetical protein
MLLNLFGFYFFFKKQYVKASLSVLVPGTIDLIFLLFLAGGISSPGVFWQPSRPQGSLGRHGGMNIFQKSIPNA